MKKAIDLMQVINSYKPSGTDGLPWLCAHNETGNYPPVKTERKDVSQKEALRMIKNGEIKSDGGKWLIFCDKNEVDNTWEKIKKATINGKLGEFSKVSTAAPSEYSSGQHVICVDTYDYKDEKDVMRIREVLFKLGIKQVLNYKRDIDTTHGKYAKNGDKHIAYYSK